MSNMDIKFKLPKEECKKLDCNYCEYLKNCKVWNKK